MGSDLWKHQEEAIAFLQRKRNALLDMSVGTGKSRCVIEHINSREQASRVLVLCPKAVAPAWEKQLRLYSQRYHSLSFPPLSKWSVRRRVEELAAFCRSNRFGDDPFFFILNYEAAWRRPMAEFLLARSWTHLVLDESHRIKSPTGTASKFVRKLSDGVNVPSAPAVICLTGTPLPHSPLDIWAQARCIDPMLFGGNFTKFKYRYAEMGVPINPDWPSRWKDKLLALPIVERAICVQLLETKQFKSPHRRALKERVNYWLAFSSAQRPNFTPREWHYLRPKNDSHAKKIVGFKNMDEFADRLSRITYQARAEDVLDLPEAMNIDRLVFMGKEQRAAYDAMFRDFMLWLDENTTVTAANALVRLLKLQQITSGHVIDEAGNAVVIGTAKADSLQDFLEDLPLREPLVVFCRFRADLERVEECVLASGREYCELSGRRNDLSQWQGGEGDVLGAQIQASREGIDLTRASIGVFFSTGFSLGDFTQCKGRLHRPGQKNTVRYYYLVAANSIDEKIYDALDKRKDLVEGILSSLREGR